MRRYTLLVWGSVVLSASALLSSWHSGLASAADGAAPVASAQQPGGKTSLYTVPEDGAPADDVPAGSRIVRSLLASHPGQDLTICIAGCRPDMDPIVYAQPTSVVPKPPVAAAPAPAPQTPIAEAPAGEAISQSSETPAQDTAPSGAQSETSGRMEPTAAQPEPQIEHGPAAAQDAPSEPSADAPSDEPSQSDNSSSDDSSSDGQ